MSVHPPGIKTKTKPHQVKTKTFAETILLANIWPIVTCLVYKSRYSGWGVQLWP